MEKRQDNVQELVLREVVPGKPGEYRQSRIVVTTENRTSFEDSKKRLADVAAEIPSSAPEFLTISGWPALIRYYTLPMERPGRPQRRDEAEPSRGGESPLTQRVTTAIAAGTQFFRLEASLAPGADSKVAKQVELIGRSLKVPGPPPTEQPEIQKTLKNLRAQFRRQAGAKQEQTAVAERLRLTGILVSGGVLNPNGPPPVSPTTPVLANQTRGELEMAVSGDGRNIVVATNGGFSFSNDGGQTFTNGGAIPASFPHDGDPSMAIGATPTFYLAFLGNPDGSAGANNVSGCSVSLAISSDTGNTFTFRNHAVLCPNGMNACGPDQEHIAADRLHGTHTGDQLYAVWRNFSPTNPSSTAMCSKIDGFASPSIVCSTNSGTNWTQPRSLGSGDFPRVAVGSDGFVYVVYRQNGNIELDKFSSCANGLTLQAGWPVTVAGVSDVACPVPGLDRCNDGNRLSSHMVAVDTNNPAHVWVAFATNNGSGENIMASDSLDGGRTFPRQVIVNTGPATRRFMPWICPVDDTAIVSWYDRRKASQVTNTNTKCVADCKKTRDDCEEAGFRPAICGPVYARCTSTCYTHSSNDLTEYFYGFARPQGDSLQSFGETDVSGTPDPQCASGWPDGARSAADFNSCSVQPQTASVGGGLPKYGDYNGNACAAGHGYFAWASATAPTGATAVSGINVFFVATPAAATLTIRKIVNPSNSSGHFFVTLDGVPRTGSVADGGTTGPLTVLPTSHLVGELEAGDASLINFEVLIGGDCAADGTVTLNPGDHKTCTITNTRRPKAACLQDCKEFYDSCVADVGNPGALTHAQCSAAYSQCKQRCDNQ
ncbi:MAG: hypothetical protein ACRD59_05890 [Candidatus Acidiferrales bacterium]